MCKETATDRFMKGVTYAYGLFGHFIEFSILLNVSVTVNIEVTFSLPPPADD